MHCSVTVVKHRRLAYALVGSGLQAGTAPLGAGTSLLRAHSPSLGTIAYHRLPQRFPTRLPPRSNGVSLHPLPRRRSAAGCKTNNVTIVYTPWSNLKKTAGMEVGQVGFHDPALVLKVKVDRKNNEIINRLEKTRQERHPDLAAEKEVYMSQVGAGACRGRVVGAVGGWVVGWVGGWGGGAVMLSIAVRGLLADRGRWA